MKTQRFLWFLFFIAWFAIFTVTVISCQKESIEPVMELTIDGKQKVLTIEKNGIGIEFCLLNEEGEPATVFNEGENFKFHLAIINNVEPDTAMYIVSDFFMNQEIFKVYDINENAIGRPWEEKFVLDRGDGTNRIDAGEKWIMESPWTETRICTDLHEPDVIRLLQVYFSGLNMDPLPAGKYYTGFSQQFCLGHYGSDPPENEFECTNTLQLKINFEIK